MCILCRGFAATLAVFLLVPSGQAAADEPSINDSVVKVFATQRPPDHFHPWNKGRPQEGSGTGIVIEGKRILTNAHVVTYASQIFVQGNGSDEKLTASVESIAPGIDLAVLKMEDDTFFDSRPALSRTEGLPELKDAVVVYGYPTGGSTLSITKGIVSRIEFAPYSDATSGLRIQIDAAINPGNSGGPAMVNDKVIGLTFSRLGGADNIGYIIPSEEIDLFLKDISDGRYDGKPALFDYLQTLENDALRAKVGLTKQPRGVLVSESDPDSLLKPWDVVVKIGDHEIDSAGMVKVKDNLRLRFPYYLQSLVKDGKVPLTIIRDGTELPIEIPVRSSRPTLFPNLNGRYPSYFIYGPLVFSRVTSDMLVNTMLGAGGAQLALGALNSPLTVRRGDRPKFEGEEIVVICSPLFPHRTSKGYSQPAFRTIKDINGVAIKNLRHLVELLRDLKDEFVTFELNERGSERLVFNRQDILRCTEEILTDNGVRRQMSDDLTNVWEPKKAN
jgi:S1-C subfamily serine protease